MTSRFGAEDFACPALRRGQALLPGSHAGTRRAHHLRQRAPAKLSNHGGVPRPEAASADGRGSLRRGQCQRHARAAEAGAAGWGTVAPEPPPHETAIRSAAIAAIAVSRIACSGRPGF
ncbi:MAG: hypothetical protein ACRDQZ_12085 [Mycobacteriales bacterium]